MNIDNCFVCLHLNQIKLNRMNTTQGYSPKNLNFDEDARARLISGVTKMAKAVKSTLGPNGNTVLIESPNHTHGITVTKDGVTVAKSIDLIDPIENLAVKMMKEAADKTATSAGDGTTTAIVLTEALVLAGSAVLGEDGVNKNVVLRDMVDICADVVESLRGMAVDVTDEMLVDVATISANNDSELGAMIADVYKQVGGNGVVAVERSQTTETYVEVTNGIKIDRGYLSPLFINDNKKDECVMDDVCVLVADIEIPNILQIEAILKPIVANGKRLLIISPCSTNVVNTLAANVMKGNIKVCAVAPPNFGYKQHELMQDIAVAIGATYFSEKTGDDLSHITMEDLGHVRRAIVGKDKTVLMKSDVGVESTVVEERVSQLWDAHKLANKKVDKDFIAERIASLTGGIGVIFVGGNTDLEQKELYDRVDDAVCAVKSAMEEGILAGGGHALNSVELEIGSREHATRIVMHALGAPINQILINAGLTYEGVYGKPVLDVYNPVGYNVKTGEYGDMIKLGVIDPLKVTRCALENAMSVAVTILSTNAIITMARSYDAV